MKNDLKWGLESRSRISDRGDGGSNRPGDVWGFLGLKLKSTPKNYDPYESLVLLSYYFWCPFGILNPLVI